MQNEIIIRKFVKRRNTLSISGIEEASISSF